MSTLALVLPTTVLLDLFKVGGRPPDEDNLAL